MSAEPCLLLMPNTCGWEAASLWHGSYGVFGEEIASSHGWGYSCTVPDTTVMSGVTLKLSSETETELTAATPALSFCHFFSPCDSHGLFLIFEMASPILSYLLWSHGQPLLLSFTMGVFPVTADPRPVFLSLPVAAPYSFSLGVIISPTSLYPSHHK